MNSPIKKGSDVTFYKSLGCLYRVLINIHVVCMTYLYQLAMYNSKLRNQCE